MGKIRAYAVLVGFSFALFVGILSSRFPPVHPDEVFCSVRGFNLLSGQGHRYSLYDDIFARPVYEMRDALPDLTRTFYHTWVGGWLKVFGRTYQHARWSSVSAGLMFLGVMYAVGCRLKTPALGLVLVLLAALNPIVLFAACLTRPEIFLMLGTALALGMMINISPRWPWKPYVIGVWCGLQTGIHWNAFAVFPGLAVFYVLMPNSGACFKRLFLLSAGFLSGALLAFATVDPEKFLLSLQTVNFLISTPPPVLGGPQAIFSGLVSSLTTWITGQSSYLNHSFVPGWSTSLAATWIGLSFALTGAGLSFSTMDHSERNWVKALAWGFGAALFMIFMLVKRQELTYVIVLFPFLLPIAGFSLVKLLDRTPRAVRALQCISVMSLLVGAGVFFSFALRYSVRTKPYHQIMGEIRNFISEPSLKVIGPSLIWFAWPHENFRDFGAIITSGWYMDGKKDIRGSLAEWRPDIVVLDRPFAKALWGNDPPGRGLKQALRVPIRFLGIVETGPGVYQDWAVYRIEWPLRDNS